MIDFPTLLYTSRSEILPFQIPDARKRYPFQAEPPRIGYHKEYSPPPGIYPVNMMGSAIQTFQQRDLGNKWLPAIYYQG